MRRERRRDRISEQPAWPCSRLAEPLEFRGSRGIFGIVQFSIVTPGEVFERFFSELERRHIAYAILHSYEDFPDRFPSDVDYAVLDTDLPKVWAIQADVAERCGWTLALTIRHQS